MDLLQLTLVLINIIARNKVTSLEELFKRALSTPNARRSMDGDVFDLSVGTSMAELQTQCGTEGYVAPEILSHKPA